MHSRLMQSRSFRIALVSGLAAAGACLVGCSAQQSRLNEYRANPTPDVDTLNQRHDDIDNRLTVTNDTNFRMMNSDIGRVLLLDRPSRLTPEPIPY